MWATNLLSWYPSRLTISHRKLPHRLRVGRFWQARIKACTCFQACAYERSSPPRNSKLRRLHHIAPRCKFTRVQQHIDAQADACKQSSMKLEFVQPIRTHECLHAHMYVQTDRQAGRQADRQAGKLAGRQARRQTDRHAHTQTRLLQLQC